MANIQDQGFAKQNYTMLDNLKLGYGGTKEEMQRLLKDAGKLAGKTFNISSYADVIEAIHVIQTELGITGTTAKEASTTIQGSLSAMKGSWQNVMTALVTGENFDEVIDNFVDSVKTFAKNIIPAIKSALGGIGKLVGEIAPIIEKELPGLINDLLPSLIKATISLFSGLIKSLPNIVSAFASQIPSILKSLVKSINDTFGTNIDLASVTEKFSEIKDKVIEIAGKIKSFVGSVIENWPTIKKVLGGVVGVIGSIALAIEACNAVITIHNALVKFKTAGDILMAAKEKILTSAVWSSVKAFGAQAVALMTNPVTWIVIGIVALIAAIILLIKNWDKVKEVALKCWDKISAIWGKVSEWFKTTIIQPVSEFFSKMWSKIKEGAMKIIQPIAKFFKGLGTVLFVIVAGIVGILCQKFLEIAGWVNVHVVQPVVSFFVALWNRIKEITNSVVAVIKTVWGVIANWVNVKIIQPVVGFFTILWTKLKNIVQSIWKNICSVWGKISGWVNENVVSPVSNFFGELWKNIKGIAGKIKNSIVEAFKTAWNKVTSVWSELKDFFNGIWDGLKDTGTSLKNALLEVWKKAVKAVATPVNKLIGGANWVLEKLGSETIIAEWKPYAKGTDGHKGGNALVNDGRGAELVQMPNGNTFIPQGRNVFIPNAPVGMKVLPAEQTAKVMGKSSPTFHYENGIGDWAIWDFFDDAKGLVSKVIDKFVSYDGMAGYALDVGKAMIGKASGAMTDWVKKMFDEFGIGGDWIWPSIAHAISSRFGYRNDPLGRGRRFHNAIDIPAPHGSSVFASKGGKITRAGWASGYGNLVEINHGGGWVTRYGHNSSLLVSEGQRVKQKQTIALVGSTGNSTGPHIHFEMRKNGVAVNPLNYTGFANGGIATRPSIFGESGAEMAIPLSWNKRQRGIKLWLQAGQILGVTPEDSYLSHYTPENSYTTTNSSSTQNNTYNPTFVLNMNGASASEDNKRKVKRWIQEAIAETFNSMERTNPLLTEV